jgi:hypothetical protein
MLDGGEVFGVVPAEDYAAPILGPAGWQRSACLRLHEPGHALGFRDRDTDGDSSSYDHELRPGPGDEFAARLRWLQDPTTRDELRAGIHTKWGRSPAANGRRSSFWVADTSSGSVSSSATPTAITLQPEPSDLSKWSTWKATTGPVDGGAKLRALSGQKDDSPSRRA